MGKYTTADNLPYRFMERTADDTERDITEELLFEIPDSWEWAKFGSITINRDGERIPLSSASREKLNKVYDYYGASGVIDKVDRFLFDKDLLLIGEDGANLLLRSKPIAFIASGQYWVNNHAHVLDTTERVLMEYLAWFINAIPLGNYVTGTAQPKMNQEKMNSIFVAVPPLDEQRRIVERIEELLPHIADYDVAEKKLTALNDGFPNALKKSILQSAVQGKLVEQDSADEPASVLLERIRAEKAALVKAGKSKKNKNESVIFRRDNSHYEMVDGIERCIDDEIPFNIPENWAWARLGSIGTFIRGSGIKRSDVQSDGVPCVRYGEIYTTYNISFNTAVSFTSEQIAGKAKKIHHGDILLTLTGENKEEIGKAVAFIGDEKIVIGGDLAKFTGHQQDPLYLSYLLNSPYAIQQKSLLGTGDIIVHISGEKLASILVSLPPIAEQYRIVDKIKELTKKTIEL